MEVCETLPIMMSRAQDQRGRVAETLSKVPIFARLTTEQLHALADRCQIRSYGPRETIFVQESPGTDLHVVLSGKVMLIRRLPEGPARLITTKEQGTAFGEMPFITGEQRSLTAISGPNGSLQIVLKRGDFDEVIRFVPEIGFTVFREVLVGFGDRMSWLPPLFRNYLVWGYRPPKESINEDESAGRLSKVPFLSLAGGAGGLLAAWTLTYLIGVLKPELGNVIKSVATTAAAALVVAGALSGGLAGSLYEWAEDSWRRSRKHARSCANCKFVVWHEGSKKHDCLYQVEKMLQVIFKPGASYDTYTDCPSFDSSLPEDRAAKQIHHDSHAVPA
jgi:hypothetical protein